jgi:hypothetical protein
MGLALSEMEIPCAIPENEPDWNESYLLAGFDTATGVGYWMHLARWRRKLDWWREIFTIALPDGTVLAHRGIGNVLAAENGPGATNYAIRVEEPGKRLTYSYRGGVHRVPAAQLVQGLLVNGYMTPLEMDLTFDAVTPIWDLGKSVGDKNEHLGKGHIEQIGRVTGTIRAGRDVFTINGMGTRDKSMGPRKPRGLHRHHWIQGLFENGIGFMLYDSEESGMAFAQGAVTHNGKIFDATVTIPFRIESYHQRQAPVTVILEYAEGRLEIVSTTIRNSWSLSYTSPIDVYVGAYQTPGEVPRLMFEQSTEWLLNGTVKGSGCIERTVPGVIGEEPD